MKNFRHLLVLSLLSLALGLAQTASASTPSLTATLNSDGDNVALTVNGDSNASVILFYTKTNVGQQTVLIGNTNSSGYFSTTVSTSGYAVAPDSQIYVTTGGINGSKSASITWPKSSGSSNITLSQTSLALSISGSANVTAYNNTAGSLYLSNNSNPPVANVSINGSQLTVTALSYGSTVATICSTASSSYCASIYIAVQSGSGQSLSFSISSVTVTPGVSVPITISGGTGSYSIINNSNSAVIQANISGATVTLSTTNTSGSAAITVCSSDMSSCGIINATAGTTSTTPIAFSQTNPTISVGQNLSLTVSGGGSNTYYVSSNSNTTALQTGINGSTLTLTGSSNGTAVVTICSSTGTCGYLTVTISYVSNGGTLQLSQSTLSMLTGQVISVTITGGTTPYNLGSNPGTIFQASLNGNIITLSGISAGSSTLYVCSAGGACATLTVIVNSSGAGTPIAFSQSNVNLNIGGSAAVTITGAGGYYVTNSSNSGTASVLISGNTAIITATAAGTNNVSICQSSGQCGILFISVSANTSSNIIPAFSQSKPAVVVGSNATITISGGTTNNYYIAANSNPSAVALSLNNNSLTITGQAAGSATIVICAATNSCGPLVVTVNPAASGTVAFSQQAPTLSVGQTAGIALSGGSGYYISANSNQTAVTAKVNGSNLNLTGLAAGTSTLTVCQSSGQCSNLNATVVAAQNQPGNASTTAGSLYSNGQLIMDNGTIYIVYKNTKVGFATAAAFLGLGFKFSNVALANNSGLAVSDKIVSAALGAHPRGSWLLNGKQVYFMTPDGLIPVPNWSMFISNGGKADLIVKANKYDLAFPKLSPMVASDSRIR